MARPHVEGVMGLTSVECWPAFGQDDGDVCFPDHTFLQLLFGYRSLPELEYAFPDCAVRDQPATGREAERSRS